MYLQKAAEKCDIPIGGNTTLWQDRTLVEVNIAVLHSYNVRTKYHKKTPQRQNIQISLCWFNSS